MIKKLRWLIKHADEIKEMLNKSEEPITESEKETNYSIAGVPDFQKDYVNDLLNGKLKENN